MDCIPRVHARRVMAQSGITLVELLTTLSLSAVLLTQAIPSFTDFIQQNRLAAFTSRFISNYQLARAEAIKRGQAVNLCPFDGAHCTADDDWSQAVVVYVDKDGDADADSDEILWQEEALAAGYGLTPNITLKQLVLSGDGYSHKLNGALPLSTLRLCSPDADDSSVDTKAREIVLNASGRLRVQVGRPGITHCN